MKNPLPPKIAILEELKIPYQIVYNKSNRITLRVKSTGIISIGCSKDVSNELLNQSVLKHLDWIKERYQIYLLPEKRFITGNSYLYLGKNYRIEIINSRHQGIFWENDRMLIYTLKTNPDDIELMVEAYLFKQAEFIFSELLYHQFNLMKADLTKYPELKIKKYRSCWGTCAYHKGLITLNLRLIHLPLELIRFIITHELVHLIYPNHGTGFHQYLRKFFPNEKTIIKEVKGYNPVYR